MPVYGYAFYNTTRLGVGLKVWIEDFIPHPKFDEISLSNDVALVRVEIPLKFDDYVRPICLPTRKMNLAGKRAVVSGWGLTSESK
ncbi:hypothetical protein HPB50_017495 [Hyalomma asiaticum]|uniref:Uncharacterized protein n=1 Tax=Hyalomma asiaticum TaxID=266040 RepID=A0ACB7RSQ5_HYAAI|nr:hypothetical protein HPB50_017495 [Hyalomma asiaticum]